MYLIMLWIVLSCLYFIFVIIYTIGLYDLLKGEGFDFNQNEYLESRAYVHTSDPGPGWHD